MKITKTKRTIESVTKQVGVTGGIGSGKTTVCKIFESLGVPVYYADDRAKAIMVENKEVVEKITQLLGPKTYDPLLQLNRAFIARVVFNDPEKLQALNSIVHPAVFEDSENWFDSNSNHIYCLKEAALLIESGSHKFLDKIIVVTAPIELRIGRVCQRDQVARDAVLARMDKQMPESEKLKYADFVIKNDGTQSLINQVWEIHQKLIDCSSD